MHNEDQYTDGNACLIEDEACRIVVADSPYKDATWVKS